MAVANHYWYQMYVDELPLWGMVGEYIRPDKPVESTEKTLFAGLNSKPAIFTHKMFSLSYNDNRIIQVNLTSANPRELIEGETYEFTMSVVWTPTKMRFADRFDRYLDFDFFENQIHWFSVFNAFTMVLFLCGLVVLILLRTLRNDYARYSKEDDDMELDNVVDQSGWKQVHADVFRMPKFLLLLAAFVGTGAQLFSLFFVLVLALLSTDMYDERGSLDGTAAGVYAVTSIVAGFVGGRFYKRAGGVKWKECMLCTAVFLPALMLSAVLLVDSISTMYHSLSSVASSTLFTIGAIWIFISCPLLLLGTLLGRSSTQANDFPSRVAVTKRPIPDGPWYTKRFPIIVFSGVLPFGSIFIEMYFVFTSFWNYKFYYAYGFLLLVFFILVMVSACVTIVATYFLLNAEDWRWHWVSFSAPASTAVYVFLYSVYYFLTKTQMTGVLQICYYFSHMGVLSVCVALFCGAIGHVTADLFVRKIYKDIKSD